MGEEEEVFLNKVWELQGLHLQSTIRNNTEVFNSYIQSMGTAEHSAEHRPENTS